MVGAGWLLGQAWCAYFVKMVWLQAYANSPRLLALVRKLNNGGALNTLENHSLNRTFKVMNYPVPGAIVIWAHGRGPQGHAGLVVSVTGNTMETIEGNTNAAGSREGDQVAEKLRTVKHDFVADGLNIIGFIHPVED